MATQKEYSRKYYLKHKDRILKRTGEYQKNNKDKINAKQRENYANNPKKYKACSLKYFKEVREPLKKARTKYLKSISPEELIALVEQQEEKDFKKNMEETENGTRIKNKMYV